MDLGIVLRSVFVDADQIFGRHGARACERHKDRCEGAFHVFPFKINILRYKTSRRLSVFPRLAASSGRLADSSVQARSEFELRRPWRVDQRVDDRLKQAFGRPCLFRGTADQPGLHRRGRADYDEQPAADLELALQ